MEWIKTRGSLRGLARWLFLATLVIAPWLYGGATAWSIELIDLMLGLMLVVWLASLFVDRRVPIAPRGLAIIAGVILLQGWWMALNAHAVYDKAFQCFLPVVPVVRQLPGAVDYVLTLAMMARVTVLLGVVFVVTEMAQRRSWLLRIWIAVAISGGSIALFGLIQKATGARMIFWQPPVYPPMENFFATYFYHANAGAFLNLVLVPMAGLAAWLYRHRSPVPVLGFWIALDFIVVLAVLSNTSRMAQAVGILIILVLLGAIARPAKRVAERMEKGTLILILVLVAITMGAIAQAVRLEQPLRRWNEFSTHFPASSRWTAYRVAMGRLGESSLVGLGPGTFRAIFPHYQEMANNQPAGIWRFLHDDYLQTVLEWGWFGSFAMAALFFGGIAVGIRNYRKAEGWSSRQRILLACVLLALGGVALHAAVDFPLQIYSIQLLVAAYLGICWGSGAWGERKEGRIRN